MTSRLSISLSVLAATLVLGGCSTPKAGDVDQVQLGSVKIIAVHGSKNFGGPIRFSGTVYATSSDGHDELAMVLNDAMAANGFKVQTNPTILYTIREEYAGPVSQFKPAQSENSVSVGTLTGLLASGVACVTLNACGNASLMTNNLLPVGNSAAADSSKHVSADKSQLGSATSLLVVHEICQIGSCARSYASSDDPNVSLGKLRLINAQEGMPRAISIKSN